MDCIEDCEYTPTPNKAERQNDGETALLLLMSWRQAGGDLPPFSDMYHSWKSLFLLMPDLRNYAAERVPIRSMSVSPAPQCALEALAVTGAADFGGQFVHRDEVPAVIEQSQNYIGVIHGKRCRGLPGESNVDDKRGVIPTARKLVRIVQGFAGSTTPLTNQA